MTAVYGARRTHPLAPLPVTLGLDPRVRAWARHVDARVTPGHDSGLLSAPHPHPLAPLAALSLRRLDPARVISGRRVQPPARGEG